jgi:hypothetical protein
MQAMGDGLTSIYRKIEEGAPKAPPFKPSVSKSREWPRRESRRDRSQSDSRDRRSSRSTSRDQDRSYSRSQSRPRGRQDSRDTTRVRFSKSPNVRKPKVASKTFDKNLTRCFFCQDFGHWKNECPELKGNPSPSPPRRMTGEDKQMMKRFTEQLNLYNSKRLN